MNTFIQLTGFQPTPNEERIIATVRDHHPHIVGLPRRDHALAVIYNNFGMDGIYQLYREAKSHMEER